MIVFLERPWKHISSQTVLGGRFLFECSCKIGLLYYRAYNPIRGYMLLVNFIKHFMHIKASLPNKNVYFYEIKYKLTRSFLKNKKQYKTKHKA